MAPRLVAQLASRETSPLPWAATLSREWQLSRATEDSFKSWETDMASTIAPVGNPVDKASDDSTAYAAELEPHRVVLRKCCGVAALGKIPLRPDDSCPHCHRFPVATYEALERHIVRCPRAGAWHKMHARVYRGDASGSLFASGGDAEHELLVANAKTGEHMAGCSLRS
eukprot:jgi/Tetstr1/462832/TSEL_007782.t1